MPELGLLQKHFGCKALHSSRCVDFVCTFQTTKDMLRKSTPKDELSVELAISGGRCHRTLIQSCRHLRRRQIGHGVLESKPALEVHG